MSDFFDNIEQRIKQFKSINRIHLPIYQSHAAIDMGKYVAVIREKRYWKKNELHYNHETPDKIKDERFVITDHIIKSVQDIEELLDIAFELMQENEKLKRNFKIAS